MSPADTPLTLEDTATYLLGPVLGFFLRMCGRACQVHPRCSSLQASMLGRGLELLGAAAIAGAFALGCVATNTVLCENGQTCPASTACVTTTLGSSCVGLDLVAACEGVAEGAACARPGASTPATCHGGACFEDACGNSLVDATEVCDDGNGVPDDDCSLDCQSTLACGNEIVDAPTGEECDEGDPLEHDGCSSACRGEAPRWVLIETQHPHANGRNMWSMAYDGGRRRVVLFGGNTNTSTDETWEYDGIRWSKLSPLVSPAPRNSAQMAYDAARNVIVLFAGSNGLADTWTWNGTSWELQQPAVSPTARMSGAMAYDSVRQQTVLFGGTDTIDATMYLNETWLWNGTAWMQVTGSGPPALSVPFMAFDEKRGVMVLFGGSMSGGGKYGETWEFDGTAWSRKASTGPSARSGRSMAFDPLSDRVVLVDGDGTGTLDDGWAWTGTEWVTTATTPGAMPYAYAVTDTARGVIVLQDFGGSLYELQSGGWVRSSTGSFTPAVPAVPKERAGHVTALDVTNRQVVVFGGNDEGLGANVLGDTWIWDGQWRQASNGPAARMGAAAAYDPIRKRTLIFGGCIDTTIPPFGDTWTFDGTAWAQVTGGTQPPARCFAQMAFDAKRGRIVMHGGGDGSVTHRSDTWTWDGTWHLESPATPGPAVAAAAMGYDEAREVVTLVGGQVDLVANTKASDTWTWDGSTWTKHVLAFGPSARAGAGMAWDQARRRLVLVGGQSSLDYSIADAWEWDGTSWALSPATEIGALEFMGVVSALDGAGVLSVGGSTFAETDDQPMNSRSVWRLRWDGLSPTERCSGLDIDGDSFVDCDDPDCDAVCTGCGDGVCDPLRELCLSCPTDCGVCP